MQAVSTQAFQGLEAAMGLCVIAMLAVLASLEAHFFLSNPKMHVPEAKSKKAILPLCLFTAGLVFTQMNLGLAQSAGEVPGTKPNAADKYPRFGLPAEQAQLAEGKKVYDTYCMGCHGITGDGQGPAAEFLNPKPRNFQTAEFRFSSRPSGDVPTDQDLFRTITEGLHGSSMSGWNLMPESDRWAVIAYLKTFAPNKWKFTPGAETTVAEDPYLNQPKDIAIKRGETAYHGMAMCFSCHAAYIPPQKINEARAVYGMPPLKAFRKDLGSVQSLQTTDGSVILPPDFLWHKLKRGSELQTLYHVVGNGISGTPMPTWKGILPEEDLWGIVYYVREMASKRPLLVTDEDIRRYYENVAKIETERLEYEEATRLADEATLKEIAKEKKAAEEAALKKAAEEKKAAEAAALKTAEEAKKAAAVEALAQAKAAAALKTLEAKEPDGV